MSKDAVRQWAQKLLDARDWFVIDTETTGLKEEHEIIEIAIVGAHGQTLLKSYIKPLTPIDEAGRAHEVNRISNAMVADAPSFPDIYPSLRDLTLKAYPIAFNADFDSRMVEQDCKRHGLPVLGVPWDCAMKQYARYAGSARWQRLEKACNDMKLPERERHGALSDALATYDLIVALSQLPETLF